MRCRPNPRLARAVDIMFILHAEHEMNCSTAAARHLASSGVDVYTAVGGELLRDCVAGRDFTAAGLSSHRRRVCHTSQGQQGVHGAQAGVPSCLYAVVDRHCKLCTHLERV